MRVTSSHLIAGSLHTPDASNARDVIPRLAWDAATLDWPQLPPREAANSIAVEQRESTAILRYDWTMLIGCSSVSRLR